MAYDREKAFPPGYSFTATDALQELLAMDVDIERIRATPTRDLIDLYHTVMEECSNA